MWGGWRIPDSILCIAGMNCTWITWSWNICWVSFPAYLLCTFFSSFFFLLFFFVEGWIFSFNWGKSLKLNFSVTFDRRIVRTLVVLQMYLILLKTNVSFCSVLMSIFELQVLVCNLPLTMQTSWPGKCCTISQHKKWLTVNHYLREDQV